MRELSASEVSAVDGGVSAETWGCAIGGAIGGGIGGPWGGAAGCIGGAYFANNWNGWIGNAFGKLNYVPF